MNYIIYPAMDGPWGEVHDYVMQDEVTQAQWELNEFGPATALRNVPALKSLIEKGSWRSGDAANVLAIIVRRALAENIIEVTEVTAEQV